MSQSLVVSSYHDRNSIREVMRSRFQSLLAVRFRVKQPPRELVCCTFWAPHGVRLAWILLDSQAQSRNGHKSITEFETWNDYPAFVVLPPMLDAFYNAKGKFWTKE